MLITQSHRNCSSHSVQANGVFESGWPLLPDFTDATCEWLSTHVDGYESSDGSGGQTSHQARFILTI